MSGGERFPRGESLICLITAGELSDSNFSEKRNSVVEQAVVAATSGVDMVQLREKGLSAKLLFELTSEVVAAIEGSGCRVIVNDRADIALAADAHGVHLTSVSLEAGTVREAFGDSLIIGVSAHGFDDIEAAKRGRADYVTFSPIFETASKMQYGPPQGLGKLEEAVRVAGQMPVIALGGIDSANAGSCRDAGARGIAAIGLFRSPVGMADTVAKLRSAGRK